jgi:hypothetical protein
MSRLAVAVLAIALSSTAAAQTLFAEVGEALPDGMGQAIAAADYEGDGDVDIFTTTGVFLNTLGFFTPGPSMPPSFIAGTTVQSVAVVDFTGDGRVDIIAIPHTTIAPGVLLYYAAPPPGGTSFIATPVGIGGATIYHLLAVADFDNDNDFDLVAASASIGTPGWVLILNNGFGVFTFAGPAAWPVAPIAASWVGAGDFDGDGFADVFASAAPNAIWRRQVAGVFGPTQVLASTLIADRGVVGDFNGDGKDDVFLVDVAGNEVVHFGSPTGLTSGLPTFGGILGPPPLASDLDGDGDDELLRSVVTVSGEANGQLFVHLGLPGGLGPPLLLGQVTFGYGNPRPYPGIAVLDVDADSDEDIAMVPGAQAPWLVINGGASGFTEVPKAVPVGFANLLVPPRDVDGDGDTDLLSGALANGTVSLSVFKNDGRGIFAPAVSGGSYPNLFIQAKVEWQDLDLDGDSDLWVGSFGSPAGGGSDTVVLNNGAGVFSLGIAVPGAGPTGAIAFGDFDGDVDVDVVIGRGATGTFPPMLHPPLFIQSTAAPPGIGYAAPAPFGIAEPITDIAVYDAEGDGDLDLLVATIGLVGGPTRVYLNDGLGGFLPLPPFPGVTASTVATGDLNADTLIDVVLGTQTWLFTGATYVPYGTHSIPTGRISLSDLDVDGDLDLIDAAGAWYPGDGAGAFGARITFVPGVSAGFFEPRAAPVDFDADGDLDLASPAGHFTIYSNMTRHAARTSLVSQGAVGSLAVFGAPGAPWLLAASSPGAGPMAIPPLGTLFLDLATMSIFTGGNLSPAGRSDVFGGVPSGPGFAGVTLSWQALVGASLTNAFDTTILP